MTQKPHKFRLAIICLIALLFCFFSPAPAHAKGAAGHGGHRASPNHAKTTAHKPPATFRGLLNKLHLRKH